MSDTATTRGDAVCAQVSELARLPRETEWLEFKVDNAAPEKMGEYVSALANAAALHGRPCGFLVWGVSDGSHQLVGTAFDPHATKVGNEALENWLSTLTDPQVSLVFRVGHTPTDAGDSAKRVVVLEVGAATHRPVRFKGEEFIRVGSYKKKLKEHPEKERELWRTFERSSFADGIALRSLEQSEVLAQLASPPTSTCWACRCPRAGAWCWPRSSPMGWWGRPGRACGT